MSDAQVARIKAHEGYRGMPYRDTEGNWTIGWGHLLEDEAVLRHPYLGGLLDDLTNKDLHENWFDQDLRDAQSGALIFLGKEGAAALSQEQLDVVVEMCFQLGQSRLSGFVKFKQAILDYDFPEAKAQMLNSRLARQTPERAREMADRFYE